MSTTGGTPQGTILMLDPPEVIRKKVKSAVTDSGSEVRRGPDKQGVTNLIDVLTVATGETPEAIESRYDGQGYGQFKSDVADAVIALLEPIQARYAELRADPAELSRMLGVGAAKAREASAPTLARDVRPHGLRPARVGVRTTPAHGFASLSSHLPVTRDQNSGCGRKPSDS